MNNNKANKLGMNNICQRKDGRYCARIMRNGVRLQKISADIRVVQKWLENQKSEIAAEQYLNNLKQKGIIVTREILNADKSMEDISGELLPTITVDELFVKWIWIKEFEDCVRPNTLRNHRERYRMNIQPVIGKMRVCNVTCEHTKRIFIKMRSMYKASTIIQAYITLGSMLKFAVTKRLLPEVPLKPIDLKGNIRKEARYLTVDEEKRFLEEAEGTANYRQCRFILETGLRCSEMIGLKWEDIDWDEEHPSITVKRNLEYRHSTKEWSFGPLKTKASYRTILLSPTAVQILKEIKNEPSKMNEDTPKEFRDLVFLNKKGLPTKNSTYDTYLYKICERAGIEHFSIHKLRHTYATRALEAGCSYKWLSQTLGHNNINTTIMTYCHVADDMNRKEAAKLAEYHKAKVAM